jgi:hypothetical protein
MPTFICNQCNKDYPKENPEDNCKTTVTYDGYGEYPTGCLYASMRELGYNGAWTPFKRKSKRGVS